MSYTQMVYGTWNGKSYVSRTTVNSSIGAYSWINLQTSHTLNSLSSTVAQTRYTYQCGRPPDANLSLISGSAYLTSRASCNANDP